MFSRSCAISSAVVLLVAIPLSASVLYVDDDATPGGDGLTWQTAYADLQLALDAAKVEGSGVTEIRIAAGTYRPTRQSEPGVARTETFQLINGVTLRGGYRGCPGGDCVGGDPDTWDIDVYETVLSGDLDGNDDLGEFPEGPSWDDNCKHVFRLREDLALDETAALMGCTISGGVADGGSTWNYDGGGIYISGCSPTITSCRIVFNAANNQGGGLYCTDGCESIFGKCMIAYNKARLDGAGCYCEQSDLTFLDCTISDNTAEENGGGLYLTGSSMPIFSGCVIARNRATSDWCSGGGIYCYPGCDPLLTDCLIVDNYASSRGGGIYFAHSDPILTNCTIANNVANERGGAIGFYETHLTLENCILWGNLPRELFVSDAWIDATYCNIAGGWEGVGNINEPPVFAFDGDYHIMPGSPGVDAGTNTPPSGLPGSNIEGVGRPQDGDGDGVAVADIGAYEFRADAPVIAVSATELEFAVSPNGPDSGDQVLRIRNCGGGTLDWEISEDCPWLQVSAESGSSTGAINDVVVSVDGSGLALGRYESLLKISSAEAVNSARTVRVRLLVHTTRHVPADYATIQEAIDASDPRDVVLLADGVYTGPGNRDLRIVDEPITVRSENGPEACIIDCEGSGRGFFLGWTYSDDVLIEGLTVRNGCPDGSGPGGTKGGAIFLEDAGATIRDCVITHNTASRGGGIYCGWMANPTMVRCSITHNTASGVGGGVGFPSSEWEFAVGRIMECAISDNSASSGAGVYGGAQGQFISHCEIVRNTASFIGGGIFCCRGTTILNCLIASNTAQATGGAMSGSGGPTVANCTIVNNDAGRGGGGIAYGCAYELDGPMAVQNCILHGNTPNQIEDGSPHAYLGLVTFCSIQGGWDGEGNIDVDPGFIADGDYRLRGDSPCVDAGAFGSTGTTWATDLSGLPRILDGDDNGTAIPDMGTYEFCSEVALISATPSTVEFVAPLGGPNPESELVTIRNAGAGTLAWQLIEGCSWLTATPTTGTVSDGVDEVWLSVDVSGLTAGEYETSVTVESEDAWDSPRNIRVVLYVTKTLNVPAEYATIQEAIDVAAPHDEVLVADGIYSGPGNRNLDFGGKSVRLRSVNGAAACTIDCTSSARGFLFHSGEDRDAVVEGFTIQNGHAEEESLEGECGGGILCVGSSPTIRRCVIRDCAVAGFGGGIACLEVSRPLISECEIRLNTAEDSGGGLSCRLGGRPDVVDCLIIHNEAAEVGGGVHAHFWACPVIRHSRIEDNLAGTTGGGVGVERDSLLTLTDSLVQGNATSNPDGGDDGEGGGVYATDSDLVLARCHINHNSSCRDGGGVAIRYSGLTINESRITRNRAGYYGGGILVTGDSECTISGCIVSENAGYSGGGMAVEGNWPNLLVESSVLMSNTATSAGGGVICYEGTTDLVNCTVVGNTAPLGGGYYGGRYSHSVITNTILYGNTEDQCRFYSSSTTRSITYSNIQGGWTGEGNIDVDPEFALDGDCHLMPESPCLDVGTCELPSGLPSTDLEGAPRSLDGDGDSVPTPDMGAYEFNSTAPAFAISPAILEFVGIPDGDDPGDQSCEIRNCGAGILNWTFAEDCSWLTVTPMSGSSSGGIQSATVSVNVAGLQVGDYEYSITLDDPVAVNGPKTVIVRLYLREPICVPSEHATIQAAIDAAPARHAVVLVADGVYVGAGNRNLDFRGKAITVRSENGPEACIIDCDQSGRGFYFHSGEQADSVVEGMTIRGGQADGFATDQNVGGGILCAASSPTIKGCVIEDCRALGEEADGGGISCHSCTPTIVDCVIQGNTAWGTDAVGGGLSLYYANARILRCTVQDNSALGTWEDGGGISSFSSSPTIQDCLISNNHASGYGGGLRITHERTAEPRISGCDIVGNTAPWGGGLYALDTPAVFVDCDFIGNVAAAPHLEGAGGAMICDGEPTFINCRIANNIAEAAYDPEGVYGGGVFASDMATFVNCNIVNNASAGDGGGIYSYDGVLTLLNCTISENTASTSSRTADGLGAYGSETIVTNCIVWGNGSHDVRGNDSLVITYSNISGGWAGEGNIDADPLFVDPDGPDDDSATWEDNDYRLSAGSPCIDAGSNLVVPLDEWDLDSDGDVEERIPFDLAGFARFIDDPMMIDTGLADPPVYAAIVDMGAYEFQALPQDCNGNGIPDDEDIASGYSEDCDGNGTPDECELCGDLDDDGSVDYDDYVIFLAAFGGVVDGVPPEDACCDADNSGDIGMADFAAWLACYRDFIGDPLAEPPTHPADEGFSSRKPGDSRKDRKTHRSRVRVGGETGLDTAGGPRPGTVGPDPRLEPSCSIKAFGR